MALALLIAWLVWSFRAEVTRYEVTDSARLEVKGSVTPVQAHVTGPLASWSVVLGKQVWAGEVLAEIGTESERLNLQEEHTRWQTLQPQLAVLKAQMASQDRGRVPERQALGFSTDAAKAQYVEAEAQAALAEQEAARARSLQAEGILARADAERAIANAESKRASADSLRVAVSRLLPEQQVREADREVRLTQVLSDIEKLKAQIANSESAMQRLEFEIERRRIRAPIAGRLGESALLHVGSHINEGDRLGVIVPDGDLQIVADFSPSAAFGKVKPGQVGTMRLQGFPWGQYGTVSATVSRVASEIRDGKVRVELALSSKMPSVIPMQHGLPGSLEIAVERISPATLILRSMGDLVGAH